jgi:hypothetical protein
MQGMSGMSDESPVKERGWIPLWCRMPRAIWKLTGWKAPTDHGTVAAGAAAAGMAGMDQAWASGMAGMDGRCRHGRNGPQPDGGRRCLMAGMDHGAMQGGRPPAAWPAWIMAQAAA